MNPKCPKCSSEDFEVVKSKIENCEFVICHHCGCIVGCLDNRIYKVISLLDRIEDTADCIKGRVK